MSENASDEAVAWRVICADGQNRGFDLQERPTLREVVSEWEVGDEMDDPCECGGPHIVQELGWRFDGTTAYLRTHT